MGKTSPTQLSLAYWRGMGYCVAITEHWNPYARIRQDLFGFIDILALGEGNTVGIQTTSWSNMSARIKKITEHENLPVLRDVGWKLLVQGWKKDSTGKWVHKIVDIS